MSARKPAPNGRNASKAGKPASAADELGSVSRRPDPALLQLLEKIFDDWRGDLKREVPAAKYEQMRHDFAFHMTDWLRDLDSLAKLYRHPEEVELEKASQFTFGFLIHVIPHLNAAGRLLLDEIGDPFAATARPAKKARPRRLRRHECLVPSPVF